MADIDKVIERIRKLLALAGNNPSEGEAMAALERAHAIAAQHNLSLSAITVEEQKDAVTMDGTLVTESLLWTRNIYGGAARLYFCNHFYTWIKDKDPEVAWKDVGYRRFDRHVFVGAKHNVVMAKIMAEYLIATVERLAREHALAAPVNERTKYMVTFRNAASWRLRARLEALRKQTAEQPTRSADGTNLPALQSLYDKADKDFDQFMVDKFFHGNSKALEKWKATRDMHKYRHGQAAEDAKKAADEISLNQQLDDKKQAALPGRE